jgi:hypothetical protein
MVPKFHYHVHKVPQMYKNSEALCNISQDAGFLQWGDVSLSLNPQAGSSNGKTFKTIGETGTHHWWIWAAKDLWHFVNFFNCFWIIILEDTVTETHCVADQFIVTTETNIYAEKFKKVGGTFKPR